jgi:hypothetical protein
MEKNKPKPTIATKMLIGFAQYFGQRILNPYSLLHILNGVIKEINAIQLIILEIMISLN